MDRRVFTLKFFKLSGVVETKIVNSYFIINSKIMTENVNNLYSNRVINISYDQKYYNIDEIMVTPKSFDNFYIKRLIEINPLIGR